MEEIFKFKHFDIVQNVNVMKVSTDSVLLGAWSGSKDIKTALDVGTGCGLLALMIAQRFDDCIVKAIDLSKDAVDLALNNFEKSPWNNRINIEHTTVQQLSQFTNEKFDFVICNPPFFTGGVLSLDENKNNIRHTAKLSHNELLRSVASLLTFHGTFAVILPEIEGRRFIELSQMYGFWLQRMCEVYHSKDRNVERLLLEFSKINSEGIIEKIVLYEADNSRTSKYSFLVKDFYTINK